MAKYRCLKCGEHWGDVEYPDDWLNACPHCGGFFSVDMIEGDPETEEKV